MRVQVDVDVQKALNRIAKYGGRSERGVKQAVAKATLSIESGAKKRAPVDTGNLRSSIKGDVNGFEGEVTAGAEYAPFVEFGTRHNASQPFMGPAAEEERPKFNRVIKEALRE